MCLQAGGLWYLAYHFRKDLYNDEDIRLGWRSHR